MISETGSVSFPPSCCQHRIDGRMQLTTRIFWNARPFTVRTYVGCLQKLFFFGGRSCDSLWFFPCRTALDLGSQVFLDALDQVALQRTVQELSRLMCLMCDVFSAIYWSKHGPNGPVRDCEKASAAALLRPDTITVWDLHLAHFI